MLFRCGLAHDTSIFDIVHDSGQVLLHQEMADLRLEAASAGCCKERKESSFEAPTFDAGGRTWYKEEIEPQRC